MLREQIIVPVIIASIAIYGYKEFKTIKSYLQAVPSGVMVPSLQTKGCLVDLE